MSNYIVNPKVPNELKSAIQAKISDAKASGQTKDLMYQQQIYTFPIIKIKRDDLYYNLANDRTLTKTREFIEDNPVDDDFFSEQNFFNKEAQSEYHKIISTFIPDNMPEVLRKTRDQRDPLYITENGIMANGNTRLSCFRNIDLFGEVECLVFPSDYSDDWEFVRQFVDLQDNAEDFSSDYPWYARAERIQISIDNMNLAEPNYGAIARNMQYKDAKEAELHHLMLKLAKELVACGRYPEYSKLSDLDTISDSGSGYQVFLTLASMVRSNDDLDHAIKEKAKKVSFEIIGTGEKGTFASQHLAVLNVWSKNTIIEEAKTLDKLEKTPNLLGGQANNENNSSKVYESDIFKNKNKVESSDVLKNYLTKVDVLKEIATSSSMRDGFARGLRQLHSKLHNLKEHTLNPDSNLDGVEDLIQDIENSIKNVKEKIQSFKS